MESSQLVSWQFEDFSTAELSPPTSPISPSSPTLFYDGSNPASPIGGGAVKGNTVLTMASSQQSQKPALSAVVTSRAQTAFNTLNELERLHYFEHQNEFGITANEESVDLNMNLFEELADIEYTPPLFSSPEEDLKPVQVPVSLPSPVPVVSSPQPHLISVTQSNEDTKLTAEFKSIVESLNSNTVANTSTTTTTSSVVSPIGNLFHIAGIPTTTVVGDECLVPVEFIGRNNASIEAEEIESMDLDGIIISNEMELINEGQLFSLEEISAELVAEADESNHGNNATLVNGVLPHWAKSMTIPLDELDTEMNKNVNTLDALLQGDVSTAKNVLSSGYSEQAFSPVYSVVSEEDDEDSLQEVIEEVVETKPKIKTERRGRKPTKANRDPLTYVKDKALRKKEQNKTAATRYRLKKKQELVATLSVEDQLQLVHDELSKEKEKIGGEVRMIRSLLRDMLQVRRQRLASSPAVSAGRVTASSIVQAQRVANRRK